MMTSREKLGIALGFAGVCLFGGTLPATAHAVTGFDPYFLSAARAVIAGLLGLATLLVTQRRRPSNRHLAELLVTGLFTIIGFPIFLALAMETVPPSHGGVVLGVMPLGTIVVSSLLTHERPSLGFWLASIAGGAIVAFFTFWHSGDADHAGAFVIERGDLYLLGIVLMGSFGYTLSGRLSRHMPGWEVISWQVALYLPVTVAAGLWWWPGPSFDPSPAAWAGFVYVSTVSMFSAFFVFNAGMALAGIARVAQVNLLQPFVIVALAIPINGEKLDVRTLLFAAAVVATVVIGQRMRVSAAN